MVFGFGKRSLYIDFLAVIVVTIIAVVSLYGLYIHSKMKEHFNHQIQRETYITIQALEKNLATLLSSYAINEYEKLVYTEMELKEPLAIVVNDFNMAKVMGEEQYITGFIALHEGKIDSFESSNPIHLEALKASFYHEKRHLIDADNQQIGEITVYMSDKKMKQELQEAFIDTIVGVILLILVLIFILFLAIKRMALDPLTQMTCTISNADSDGIPTKAIPHMHYKEIAIVAESINAMLETIKSSRILLQESHKEAIKLLALNRLIIETIPDLLWLKDADGKYLLCNDKFKQLYGAKEQDIIGKCDYDFVEPALADFFRANDVKAMQAAHALTNEERLAFASDGRMGLFQTTKVPLVKEDGTVIGVMGIAHDVSEYKMLIGELDALRKLYLSLLNTIPLNIVRFDIQGKTTFANKTFLNLLHVKHEDLIGTNWYDLYPPLIVEEYRQKDEKVILSKKMLQTTHIFSLPPHMTQKIIEVIRIPILDGEENVKEIQVVFWDVTEKISKEQELEYSAKHDSLTGLPNRFLFNELIQKAMYRCKRKEKLLALLFIDLDGFKTINDSFGHEAGDEVLKTIAGRLETIFRTEDVIARIGGDEFVVAVSELSSENEILTLIDRLLIDIHQPIFYQNEHLHELHISASVGVTFYPQEEDIGSEALLRQSDQAMYQAKLQGKNRYHVFDLHVNSFLKTNQKRIEEIEDAIKNDAFSLFYQPKVDMKEGRVIGFEALLRWQHPEEGLLYPDSFLPLLHHDKTLMVLLGEWVFKTAFRQYALWREKGFSFGLSINMSAHEFKEPKIFTLIQGLLKEYAINPEAIELEILETSALEDMKKAKEIIQRYKALGLKIALDDFGTGYSTLSYLKELPVDTLKIDKSFVIDMLHDSGSFSILEAAMGLADAFRCDIVAEGVESIEHGTMLVQLGFRYAQGYAIAKAMPAQSVMDWVNHYEGFTEWQKIHCSMVDKNLIFASIEHCHWFHMLQNHVTDPKHNARPELNSSLCRFGEWMNKDAKKSYHDTHVLTLLDSLHEQIHMKAQAMVMQKTDEASRLKTLEEIQNLHRNIVYHIKQLS